MTTTTTNAADARLAKHRALRAAGLPGSLAWLDHDGPYTIEMINDARRAEAAEQEDLWATCAMDPEGY